MRSNFSEGAGTGFCSGLDSTSTCESPLLDCTGFVESPGANKEDVAPLHAPKPPDDGVTKEGEVLDEPLIKLDVDPNAGCPKAGVDFGPKPVCPNPEAELGASSCEVDDEDVSGLAWFQLENAPKPGLTVEELKAGVEEGWITGIPNKPPWSFPCAGFESPSPPKDRPPKPPSPESIPIETSLIISEDFESP